MQDTVSALRRNGWSVDVLTPSRNPILAATLDPDVRVFTVPHVPFLRRLLMFLRGVALVRHVAHLEDVARADLWLGVPAARGVVVFRVRAHDFLRPSGNVQARMSLLEA